MTTWHPVSEPQFVEEADWCFANIVAGQDDEEEWVSCVVPAQVFFAVDGPYWMDPTTGYPLKGVTHYMPLEFPAPPEEA